MRALASPLPIAWVTADSAYGHERRLRRMLEETGVGYVLAVPESQHVHAPSAASTSPIAQALEDAWERHSCGAGAKGPRVYDWAAARLPAIDDFDGDEPTHDRWVLARRSLARPDEIAYYLAYAPAGTPSPSWYGSPGRAGDRKGIPGREERVRPGSVRGPPVSRLAPAHHPGHARPQPPPGADSDPRGQPELTSGGVLVAQEVRSHALPIIG
jgi:hypothetical protein